MCRLRGFHHRCNHVEYRTLSECRGTHASPESTWPRCIPSATIIISLGDKCLPCKHKDFCDEWDQRLDEAKKKRDSLIARISGKSIDEVSCDWPWGNERSWGCEDLDPDMSVSECWDESVISIDGTDGTDEHDDQFHIHPALRFQDPTLIQQRDEAILEVQELQAQYNRDNWDLWQEPFLRMGSKSKKQDNSTRRRMSKAKINCGSPLKHVENAVDLPDAKLRGGFRRKIDLSNLGSQDRNGEASDGSTSPALSHCSTLSDESGSSDENEELMVDIEGEQKYTSYTNGIGGLRSESIPENGNTFLPVWLDIY